MEYRLRGNITLGKVIQLKNQVFGASLLVMALGWLFPVPSKASSPLRPYVANASQCRSCHEEQYQFWSKTKHAAAYLVLFSKQSHFDWECMGCHSVGFGKPEGFSRIAHPLILEDPKEDPER